MFYLRIGLPSRFACLLILFASLIVSQLDVITAILGAFGGSKYEAYVKMDEHQSALKIVASNLLAFFIIYHRKHFEKSKVLTYFFQVWMVGAILYNGFVQFSPVTRISYYFGFFSIPLLIYATSVHTQVVQLLTRAGLILFFSMAFAAAMYNDTQAENPLKMSNYKTIFEAP